MGLPQTPAPPHLYPQALQLKLYQAFIFSIPILFSIILFLLFYLFYLKRRASSLSFSSSSSPPILPTSSNALTLYVTTACQVDSKADNPIEKLPKILFNEELRARDSLCCVCLGEFEIKEELLQVPSCKHVFHIDCMNHWLTTNSTCPLCRCSVIPPIRCPDPPVAAPSPTLPLPSELPLTSNQTAEMVSYSLRHPQLQQQEGSSQSIC
ncbi:probable E3 ubiquitin-protein ligase RHA4A [Momordica charantia]|uniref:RING-type E3 ubiquitin transferase n=1 Tax=Momordica charantia TaxID=3673 RepID=A0A6J1DWP0_MOMCH|nr:probable E3 ubiquitin-protein ligase RHA4A [Momordica charantia]